jgi:hypothetical protein
MSAASSSGDRLLPGDKLPAVAVDDVRAGDVAGSEGCRDESGETDTEAEAEAEADEVRGWFA